MPHRIFNTFHLLLISACIAAQEASKSAHHALAVEL